MVHVEQRADGLHSQDRPRGTAARIRRSVIGHGPMTTGGSHPRLWMVGAALTATDVADRRVPGTGGTR